MLLVFDPGFSANEGFTESETRFDTLEGHDFKFLNYSRSTVFFTFFRRTMPVVVLNRFLILSFSKYLRQAGS